MCYREHMDGERKKILYVITKSNFGGAQRYVYDLATGLTDTYEVAVALGGEGTLAQKLADSNIRTIPISSLQRDVSLIKELFSFFSLLRVIYKERPDILHLNSSKAGGLGALAGRMLRVPHIVFTAHGWEFNNQARGHIARWAITFFSWLIVVLSHTTITVSRSMKTQMERFPFVQKKLRVVHNGIAPQQLYVREAAQMQLASYDARLEKAGHYTWVGMLSELHPVKGVDVAIEAFAKLAETNSGLILVVCGGGDDRPALMRKITEAKLEERVFLLGHVDDASSLLSAFDIFLFPSRSEGLGYALLEAGIARLPVIATDVGGTSEVITHEQTGLLIERNAPEALANAIRKVAADTTYATRLGEALYQNVSTHFSLHRMQQETEAVYNTKE